MKAEDYFYKYFRDVDDLKSIVKKDNNVIYNLMMDLFQEIQEIANMRKAKSNEAFYSIINELNDKVYAINNMIEKKYGIRLFTEDAFKTFVDDMLKEEIHK